MDLEKLFEKHGHQWSLKSICSLTTQLIDIFKVIHEAGYVFNDLKLDNLLLDFGIDIHKNNDSTENIFKNNTVNIIDFGFATRYVDRKTQ